MNETKFQLMTEEQLAIELQKIPERIEKVWEPYQKYPYNMMYSYPRWQLEEIRQEKKLIEEILKANTQKKFIK